MVSAQSRFNYAWALIKSNQLKDQRLGVKILTDFFKDSPEKRMECLYYLTIGTFKIGDYADSRKYIDTLLRNDPGNQQALDLKKKIESKIETDGLIGIGIVSGVVAIGAIAASLLFRKKH